MAETIYVGDDQVGIQFDDRGPIVVVGRDGRTGEQFTPPPGSEPLVVDHHTWDQVEDHVMQRVRNVARARGLSEKTIAAITATGRETS